MKYYKVIPAKAVLALIMNAILLAWLISELTGKKSYADVALIIVAIAGFAGSTFSVVHEIKRVKRRGKCTHEVRAECTDVQKRADASESGDEAPGCSVKWKFTFFGREYEVCDENYTGTEPKVGSARDMLVDPEDPNVFCYDTKPRWLFVLIGVISGAAMAVSVGMLIFAKQG